MTIRCLTELHGVFKRRTSSIANQVSDILWCSLHSAPLCLSSIGGNAERKIVDRRSGEYHIERSGWKKTKNRVNILYKCLLHNFGSFHWRLWSLSPSNLQKYAWSVKKEKSSSRDLPTVLISSRDGWKRIAEKYLWVYLLVWMSGYFHLPASVTDFSVMRYVDK